MTQSTKPYQFRIQGMDCAEEITLLRRELGPLVGGEEFLSFDLLNGQMAITPPANTDIDEAAIEQAVRRTGMTATRLSAQQPSGPEEPQRQRSRLMWFTVLSGGGTLVGFGLHVFLRQGFAAVFGGTEATSAQTVPIAARLVYLAAIIAGVWHFVPKAIYSVRRLRPDMNLLMVVAVCGAIYLGDWLEAATVAFLFTLSLALESWSIARARRAVAALLDLTPSTVAVLGADRTETIVGAEKVAVGTRFAVRAGQRIPLDGKVVAGNSEVNQAPLTGESQPAPKSPGDAVYAGTVNGSATLEIESTKAVGETTLAHIIRLVGQAQAKRAPSEQWVESFARYYTPIVMASALAVFLVGGLVTGDFSSWLYRALVLLVIACPCALVISTPVSIVAAMAGATRRGILIKGGLFVEAPARLRAIAFDKTGTLTAGKPSVVSVIPFQDHDERALLERAAALEVHSTHPLAVAITEYARAKGVDIQSAERFQLLAGKGAVGDFQGRPFWIGSHRYLEERGQETDDIHQQIVRLADVGHSVVVIGNDQHVCGFIVLSDAVRPSAAATLTALRSIGIEHLVMLSGDNKPTAEAIATGLGIDEVRAELLPADKVTAIDELLARYGSVAMVGDGINDAPALGRATLGIAMGSVGSDAAIETADIALMGDDISQLSWLISHSRRTLSVIRQNITFALAVKTLFVLLTLFGHGSLWAAIAADTGASLLVIFNGLRLLR